MNTTSRGGSNRRPLALTMALVAAVTGAMLGPGVAHGAPSPAPTKSAGTPSATQVPLDVNTATEAQLTAIPGIGPALARRIVEFREQHGPFRRVEDVIQVQGIGEKSFQKIQPYLKVDGRK